MNVILASNTSLLYSWHVNVADLLDTNIASQPQSMNRNYSASGSVNGSVRSKNNTPKIPPSHLVGVVELPLKVSAFQPSNFTNSVVLVLVLPIYFISLVISYLISSFCMAEPRGCVDPAAPPQRREQWHPRRRQHRHSRQQHNYQLHHDQYRLQHGQHPSPTSFLHQQQQQSKEPSLQLPCAFYRWWCCRFCGGSASTCVDSDGAGRHVNSGHRRLSAAQCGLLHGQGNESCCCYSLSTFLYCSERCFFSDFLHFLYNPYVKCSPPFV